VVGVPSQTSGWQVPPTQLEGNTHSTVDPHEPPSGTVAMHVPGSPFGSKLQNPPTHVVGEPVQTPPGRTMTMASQSEVAPLQAAAEVVGSQKKIADGSQASPSAGSFVQMCITWSHWALNGQTLLLLQSSPIPTGVVHAKLAPPGVEAEQTRLSAHSVSVQAWPIAAGATQVPHMV